jgi:peptidoglycan pentaglycine glycine transferase (the first glycine)
MIKQAKYVIIDVVKNMKIQEITNDEMQSFINKYPLYSVYQTPEYALAMNKENFDSILLGLKDDNHIIIAATLLLIEKNSKYKCAYAPRGFLLDYQDSNLLKIFTKEIKKYLSNLGIISVKLSPMIVKATYDMKVKTMTTNNYYDIIFNNLKTLGYRHLGYNAYFEAMKPRYTAMINIEKPYYMIFNSIHKEYKTKIRSASKKGVEVYLGTYENLDYLYLQTARKYPRDLKYFQNIYKYFKKENKVELFYTKINTGAYLKYVGDEYHNQNQRVLYLLDQMNKDPKNRNQYIEEKMQLDKKLAYKKQELIKATRLVNEYPDGIISASALVIKGNKEVTLFMDGYDPKFKRFNSKHLLIWKLLEKYSNEGYSIFNFGGVTSVTLKENKYEGLNNFKIGFNSTIVEYIGDLELITNKTLYLLEKSNIPLPHAIKK